MVRGKPIIFFDFKLNIASQTIGEKMYKNKIVAILKHKNIPLEETKEEIFIPFNTIYNIYLKNLSDKIAYISIYINGRNVGCGKKVKLLPKQNITIDKFDDTKNSFMFVERTRELQRVRENQEEDSIVRIEVEFEKKTSILQDRLLGDRIEDIRKEKDSLGDIYKDYSKRGRFYENDKIDPKYQLDKQVFGDDIVSSTRSLNEGITVPGKVLPSDSDTKKFIRDSSSFNRETFTILLKLVELDKPIQIKQKKKKKCSTCQKKYKSTYFYCPFDGTFLINR